LDEIFDTESYKKFPYGSDPRNNQENLSTNSNFRSNASFVYPGDDCSFSDSRYYGEQNSSGISNNNQTHNSSHSPIQFERIEQTIEGCSESERENQTHQKADESLEFLGNTEFDPKSSISNNNQTNKNADCALLPTPSLSRQVSDDAFLDDILKDLSKGSKSSDQIDSEFFDAVGASELINWWPGPVEEQDKRRSSAASNASLPNSQYKNSELSGMPSQSRNSSHDEPRVSHENQYFGSYASTSDTSSPKKTQNYAPAATTTATSTASTDQNRVFGNQTNSSQQQKPVARCSPIMIQSNNNNNNFSSNNSSFIPSPPMKSEKIQNIHTTPSQHSPPQNFQPDQNSKNNNNNKVQVVQLVQSTCGQAYFVVQN